MSDDEPLILPAVGHWRGLRLLATLLMLCVLGAMFVMFWSLHHVVEQRDNWKSTALKLNEQLDEREATDTCQNLAEINVERASAALVDLLGSGLGTVVAGLQSIDDYLADLRAATADLDAALDHHEQALSLC